MICWKFLDAGRGPWSDFAWPLPASGKPGVWVETDGALHPCRVGVHACGISTLAYWARSELWEIELDGVVPVSVASSLLLAQRGRLIRRVERWNTSTQRAFCDAAVARIESSLRTADESTRDLLGGYAEDARNAGVRHAVAEAGFIAAVAIATLAREAEQARIFREERVAQSHLLAKLAGISEAVGDPTVSA